MSRSRKKVPVLKDGSCSGRPFNRAVRKATDLPDGNTHRKLIERWDFNDVTCGWYSDHELRDWIEKYPERNQDDNRKWKEQRFHKMIGK